MKVAVEESCRSHPKNIAVIMWEFLHKEMFVRGEVYWVSSIRVIVITNKLFFSVMFATDDKGL